MTTAPAIQEPLTLDSIEVQMARAFLIKTVGEAYSDDLMERVLAKLNEKKKAA